MREFAAIAAELHPAPEAKRQRRGRTRAIPRPKPLRAVAAGSRYEGAAIAALEPASRGSAGSTKDMPANKASRLGARRSELRMGDDCRAMLPAGFRRAAQSCAEPDIASRRRTNDAP